jgi:hypothetical protein
MKPKKHTIRKLNTRTRRFFADIGIPAKLLGYYYQVLHYIIIFGGGFIILFNTNPYHLLVLLVIISLDAFANVVVHDCPLTALERKYLKTSLSDDRRKDLKRANIMYKCNHVYESQVELIVNMWTMVACKIIIILVMRSFTPTFIHSCCGVQPAV